jgi:hypothetical protein
MVWLLFALLCLVAYAWARTPSKPTLASRAFHGGLTAVIIGVACWQAAAWIVEAL